jgi:hypothetical protein
MVFTGAGLLLVVQARWLGRIGVLDSRGGAPLKPFSRRLGRPRNELPPE